METPGEEQRAMRLTALHQACIYIGFAHELACRCLGATTRIASREVASAKPFPPGPPCPWHKGCRLKSPDRRYGNSGLCPPLHTSTVCLMRLIFTSLETSSGRTSFPARSSLTRPWPAKRCKERDTLDCALPRMSASSPTVAGRRSPKACRSSRVSALKAFRSGPAGRGEGLRSPRATARNSSANIQKCIETMAAGRGEAGRDTLWQTQKVFGGNG